MNTTPQPRISLVILTYNSGKFVAETLSTALQQTLKPYEIIVSDDCSSDTTWALLQEYAEQYPGLIKARRNAANLGISGNTNAAFALVGGDWFVLAGGDDPFHPRLLEAQWQALRGIDTPAFAFTNFTMIDVQGKHIDRAHDDQKSPVPVGDIFAEVASRQLYNRQRSLFRNELVPTALGRELGLADDRLETFQDWDFKTRLCAHARAVYTPEACAYYRLHEGGFSWQDPALNARAYAQVYENLAPRLASRNPGEQLLVKFRLESDLACMSHDPEADEKDPYSVHKVLQFAQLNMVSLADGPFAVPAPELNHRMARLIAKLAIAESGLSQRLSALVRLLFSPAYAGRKQKFKTCARLVLGPGLVR